MKHTNHTIRFWIIGLLACVSILTFQVIFAATDDVILSWTASTDNIGVSGYKIYRSSTNGGPYTQIGTSVTTSYTDTTTSYGSTYYYVVQAYDAANNSSGNSNQATAVVPAQQVAPVCGNNLAEAGEVCDGSDLSGQSCASQGFASGALTCNQACSGYVTSQCIASQAACTESWNCSAWSSCTNSSQTRTCTDTNACGTTVSRPGLTQSCTMPATGGTSGGSTGGGGGGASPNCTPSWVCSEWTSCQNNVQTRACTDSNACGSTAARPSQTQSCASSPISGGTVVPPYTPSSDPAVAQKVIDTLIREKARATALNTSLRNRLLGWILLQTQEKGEAWYLEPLSKLRYYLANGSEAYKMLSRFGLGITDADLKQIPVGLSTCFQGADTDADKIPDKMEEGIGTDLTKADTDSDTFSDGDEILGGYNPLGAGKLTTNVALTDRLKGRILLQVQAKGQAWYLNPKDGKRYYTQNGDAAYQIMRCLSLGVSNSDLNTIVTGE